MNKIIVLGLCGVLAACGGDDSTNNNVSVLPDVSSVYDGVYSSVDGMNSLFYAKREDFTHLFFFGDQASTGANRLISFKAPLDGQYLLAKKIVMRHDTFFYVYSDADVDIELFENEANIKLVSALSIDGLQSDFYKNEFFEKKPEDQIITLKDGVIKDAHNKNVTISANQTRLETIYDEEVGLNCRVETNLTKFKFYYQAQQAKIICDDPDSEVNGDYEGVVYRTNDRAVFVLTKTDFSSVFRTSFTLN
ncbi:TPA: hypothetical protein ACRZ4F_005570 [Vibrio harveyi]